MRKDGLLLDTIAEDDDIAPTRTVEERLAHIQRNANKLEKDIDILYKQFQVSDDEMCLHNHVLQDSSNEMKQRVSELERVFKTHKKEIKKDCILGLL